MRNITETTKTPFTITYSHRDREQFGPDYDKIIRKAARQGARILWNNQQEVGIYDTRNH